MSGFDHELQAPLSKVARRALRPAPAALRRARLANRSADYS
jgi:hypothetical protein